MKKLIRYRILFEGLFGKNKKPKFKAFDCLTVETPEPPDAFESIIKECGRRHNLRSGQGILTLNLIERHFISKKGHYYDTFPLFEATELKKFTLNA